MQKYIILTLLICSFLLGEAANHIIFTQITIAPDEAEVVAIYNPTNGSINLSKIKIKPIFKWLKQNNIKDHEMLRTFNCGVGFCIIIKSKNFNKIKKYFTKSFQPYVIGKILNGKKSIDLHGKIKW